MSTFPKQAPAWGQGWGQRVDVGGVSAGERRASAYVAARASGDLAPEIAFLAAQGVEPGRLLRAMAAANSAGVSADQALLGEGLLGEEVYYRALARHLRLPFYRGEIAIAAAVDAGPAIACGVAPLTHNRAGLRAIAAPRAAAVRYLLAQGAAGALPAGLAIASPQRLSAMVRAQAATRIAEAAAGALERYDGALSAHSGLSGRQCLVLAASATLWLVSSTLAPGQTALAASSALWALFAGAIVLRNLAVAAADDGPRCAPLVDAELPVYTIIAPLRGEERMVGKLTRALDALDFRIRTLRRVGAWDAWNVTEDADLGIRFALAGARVGALASETREEAPAELTAWFRQRVRWQKGWMQTLIVHSRRPRRFARALGLTRALAALAMIGGATLGGLFGPPLFFAALWHALSGDLGPANVWRLGGDVAIYLLALSGLMTAVIPGLTSMRRRGIAAHPSILATLPIYYGLICLATWAALFDLAIRPFYWSKTVHGRGRAAPSASFRPGARDVGEALEIHGAAREWLTSI